MSYELMALILWILACVTGSIAFHKMVDQHVADYAHDIRRDL